MNSIPLPPDLERRVRRIAESRGEDFDSYVSRAIQRQVDADESMSRDDLDRAIQRAGKDPLFLADFEETMDAFRFVDSETARMLPDD